jgi:pyruvate formate lyase activating enzyme
MEALYYHSQDSLVQCTLCPHNCLIRDDHAGICRVRRNQGGILVAESYGRLSAIHLDPVEKKPLYHYFPGNNILSVGSVGCNMRCGCCQNWEISQVPVTGYPFARIHTPADIVDMTDSADQQIGVAYTYNEPGIWFEFMLDTARLVQAKGLKNVMVSNGYISPEPLDELLQYIDAFNIDLKGFTDDFYRTRTGARLEPVLDSLKSIRRSGRHLEITFLVIPSLNDGEDEFRNMIGWISGELGRDTVLHLSRYHPMYKLNIEANSRHSLEHLYAIAREKLFYVYVGNLETDGLQDTYCPVCGDKVIARSQYHVNIVSLNIHGACLHCGTQITKNE